MLDFLPYANTYLTRLSLFKNRESFISFLNQLDGKHLKQNHIILDGAVLYDNLKPLFGLDFVSENISRLSIRNREVIIKPVNETLLKIGHKLNSNQTNSMAIIEITIHDHKIISAELFYDRSEVGDVLNLLNNC